jgi:hypothetical protein
MVVPCETFRDWQSLINFSPSFYVADLVQLSFQPVPSQAELQTSVPAGRLAVAAKAFAVPVPAFGPGSVEFIRKHADSLDLGDGEPSSGGQQSTTGSTDRPSYAGAGSYF